MARLLRCVAYRLDPRSDVVLARAKHQAAIDRYARAERELLNMVSEQRR